MNTLKKLLPLIIALIAIAVFFPRETTAPLAFNTAAPTQSSTDPLAEVFHAQRSNVSLDIELTVQKILSDDERGSRHQRFIAESAGGIRVLIAHNIDLAPRLEGLQAGDKIRAVGEYEWNDKGGVLHWTHHDPAGRHADGYLQWRGRRYQ